MQRLFAIGVILALVAGPAAAQQQIDFDKAEVTTKDLGSTSCTVLMADAVKAVPPDLFVKPFVWTRINRRYLRHLRVKSGIEHGYWC